MPPRRAAAARGGRRPAGVPGPQQVVVGLGTSFFGAPAKKLHHQPLLRDRRLGPLRQVPSRALSTRSAEQLDLRVFCIRFAARRCFRWRALPASPDRPPGPPGPSTSTGQGRARPASGRWGRNSRLQGCLRRRTGPGTWLSPRSPPPARPPPRPACSPSGITPVAQRLPSREARLAFAPSERPPGHAGSPRGGADPAGAWWAGQARPFQPPRPRPPRRSGRPAAHGGPGGPSPPSRGGRAGAKGAWGARTGSGETTQPSQPTHPPFSACFCFCAPKSP